MTIRRIIIISAILVTALCGTWVGFNTIKSDHIHEELNIPDGMVFVPGGETLIGNESEENTFNSRHQSDNGSPFIADVDPFFMDKYPVTVAQFREFTEDTGFITEAERFGNAAVFDKQARRWILLDGANWEYPRGPDKAAAPDDHPVTQVSWHDAIAYANWAGKRLPTEVEWEHAARGAVNDRSTYAWNKEVVKDNDHTFYANIWQGDFPLHNSTEDGYEFTSPVEAFGETELGLSDMGGNVWEWTEDWYRPYAERDQDYTPNEYSTKVQRGGSFQCSTCEGYTVYSRSHTTPETSLFHVGFRTVRDLDQ